MVFLGFPTKGKLVDVCNHVQVGGNSDSDAILVIGQWQNCVYTSYENKAGYTATLIACGWAGAVMEKVTKAFAQEQ